MSIPRIRFPLGTKIAILVTSLLLVLFIVLNHVLLRDQGESLTRSLIVKGNTLIDNFALYCQNASITGDELNIEDYTEVLLKDPEVRRIFIVLKNSTYYLNSDPRLLGKKFIPPVYLKTDLEKSYQVFTEKERPFYQFYRPVYNISLKGERYYLGMAYIDLNTKLIGEKLNRFRMRLLILFCSVFILGILGAVSLSLLLVNPIRRLIRGVAVIGSGNLRHRITLCSRDEIEDLSQEFNRMTRKLLLLQNKAVRQKVLQQEIAIAKNILSQIIPSRLVPVPGHRIFHFYRPSHHISGDYFNLLKLDRSRYLVIIADVSGKGIPAALLMAILHTVIATLKDYYAAPLEFMRHINATLSPMLKKGDFITAQLALLNARTGRTEIVSAGHEYPLIIGFKDRSIQYLKTEGIPIGLFDKEQFESRLAAARHTLAPGSLLLFFTDGIRNIRRFPFNNKKLLDFIRSLLDNSANSEQFEKILLKSVRLKNYRDDLTILGVKKD